MKYKKPRISRVFIRCSPDGTRSQNISIHELLKMGRFDLIMQWWIDTIMKEAVGVHEGSRVKFGHINTMLEILRMLDIEVVEVKGGQRKVKLNKDRK